MLRIKMKRHSRPHLEKKLQIIRGIFILRLVGMALQHIKINIFEVLLILIGV